MSALAMILASKGLKISGSDKKRNSPIVKKLIENGVKIFKEQKATNISEITQEKESKPLIVTSSAIQDSNLELAAAQAAQLEICHRSDLLAALVNQQPSIAIAGTHGKTTTSTILATLMAIANQDPTAVVGGIIPYYKSNFNVGKGKFLIAEADESDGTLVKLNANIGLITNLELEHVDHYSNLQELIKTVKSFQTGCKNFIANYDCTNIRENIEADSWFSINEYKGVDFAAIPNHIDGNKTIATIYENEKIIKKVTIPLSGYHNLSNTIAAISICRLANISYKDIFKAIPSIMPPSRRFQYRGNWNQRLIFDDYAHHPSEIKASIELARLILKSGNTKLPIKPARILVIFQPHRYSRTKIFLEEFAYTLSKADEIILAPIYSAGEQNIYNINSYEISKKILTIQHNSLVSVAENKIELMSLIKEKSKPKDLLIAMGAGDINDIWESLNNQYSQDSLKSNVPA